MRMLSLVFVFFGRVFDVGIGDLLFAVTSTSSLIHCFAICLKKK
jgi:hypothetical protein